jgi:V8-like Glu-specific endopeptidase
MTRIWYSSAVRGSRRPPRQAHLWLEHLETRLAPSASRLMGPVAGDAGDFQATIVAGDPNGNPPDSPGNRVDANTTASPFAGIGSIQVNARRGIYIGTGTPLDATHILTAAHVLDLNNDGKTNSKDGIKSSYFILNFDGNQSHKITIASINLHPHFSGFNRPSVNDDLAILTLAKPLPADVPTYGLPTSDLQAGTTLTMVGYGRSGDGVNGYTVEASFTVKRSGQNNADAFYTQDDAGQPANEVFRYDFDGPSGNGSMGGSTLGNNLETTLGGGDSGGPSLIGNVVAGVNTFTQAFFGPYFGTSGGGINVFPYVGWINSVTAAAASAQASTQSNTSDGDRGNGKDNGTQPDTAPMIAALVELLSQTPRPAFALPTAADLAVRFTGPVIPIATQPMVSQAPLPPASAASGFLQGRLEGIRVVGVQVDAEEAKVAEPVLPEAEREVRPVPAPAPVPRPEDAPEAPDSAWLRARDALFAFDAETAFSPQETIAGGVTPEAPVAPAFNKGAALAGMALLLGGMSGRLGLQNQPPQKRLARLRPRW